MKIAVVMPCYRVRGQVLDVLRRIGPEVRRIYCVDDGCPDLAGDYIETASDDPRVTVLRHAANEGVGAATITGYRAAIADGADIIVKLDADGQMDPVEIPRLVWPIAAGMSDYTKGNRFFDVESLAQMPRKRLFGNAVLSFMTKVSSGYWDIFDPTNGYTAIHAAVAEHLRLDKVARGYFFESDILFRLNVLGAVVTDIPMPALYGTETSSLRVRDQVFRFLAGNLRNVCKRFVYSYLIRDFNVASLQTLLGAAFVIVGGLYGAWHWIGAWHTGTTTPAGTVMVAALPILVGLQLWLAAINYDVLSVPRQPMHPRLVGHLEGGDHRIGGEDS